MFGRYDGQIPKTFKFLKFLFHLPSFLKLAWRLFKDSRVPVFRKAILVIFALFALAFFGIYLLIPTDLIPDILAPIGYIDDPIVPIIAIFVPGIYLFIKSSPKEIVLEHVQRIDRGE